ncbi:hypothetical protein SAMD00019534_104660 [Acytostelium subglobosum LB1]|uniref:hypothetical protein n=1 Tax=Acytostelium subglobosum LB1 TaxID=1410327 RepID=UPI000644B707|nr:hypothetical protein SAMD00019534_104660 [Acytostelium subglobosum LB1]GAM27291.1 hypothetical protein SAMD00019534_104660 [Acytostelium subglobosum LB1]|eukprot:XP_012749758.1 hypothetical protein SAMD00019534_104660 [Acytostelium subglobosum LB1]
MNQQYQPHLNVTGIQVSTSSSGINNSGGNINREYGESMTATSNIPPSITSCLTPTMNSQPPHQSSTPILVSKRKLEEDDFSLHSKSQPMLVSSPLLTPVAQSPGLTSVQIAFQNASLSNPPTPLSMSPSLSPLTAPMSPSKKSKNSRVSKSKWTQDADEINKWQKTKNPGIVKGPWKEEEDAKLVELVNKNGPKEWSSIAAKIPGRIGKQCRERWFNHLSPEVRKTNWTPEEDRIIIESHLALGNKWTAISKLLDGRPANAIKNPLELNLDNNTAHMINTNDLYRQGTVVAPQIIRIQQSTPTSSPNLSSQGKKPDNIGSPIIQQPIHKVASEQVNQQQQVHAYNLQQQQQQHQEHQHIHQQHLQQQQQHQQQQQQQQQQQHQQHVNQQGQQYIYQAPPSHEVPYFNYYWGQQQQQQQQHPHQQLAHQQQQQQHPHIQQQQLNGHIETGDHLLASFPQNPFMSDFNFDHTDDYIFFDQHTDTSQKHNNNNNNNNINITDPNNNNNSNNSNQQHNSQNPYDITSLFNVEI